MKKVFVILVSLALMLTFIGTVSAENHAYIDDADGTQVEVVYEVGQSYVITIPAEIRFGTSDTIYDWVNATDLRLPYGKTLRVTVNSTHKGNMALHNNGQAVGNVVMIPYTLTADEDPVDLTLDTPQTVLVTTINNVDALNVEIPLEFKLGAITNLDLIAGIYKDKMTFTASLS